MTTNKYFFLNMCRLAHIFLLLKQYNTITGYNCLDGDIFCTKCSLCQVNI